MTTGRSTVRNRWVVGATHYVKRMRVGTEIGGRVEFIRGRKARGRRFAFSLPALLV
jgi:hypothetical protein